ncbi:MaoC family dehydratase N-terminal domain-containing protein [Azospirillum sp. A26]|uniref:FAS1-like dehydratase domain-containing protein n=1 Tax=Azospirillum sp. A26 TaxID=3160607 RepID=UPI00366F14EF
MTFDTLKDWIGRVEMRTDTAIAAPLAGLAATLDHDTPPWSAGELPPLGHWLHFLPNAPQRDIGEDGHPHKGGFLPPVPLPRRMWAGSDMRFLAPIPIGAEMRRTSTIEAVERKAGRSGEMVFVSVVHEIATDAGVAIREKQDIVYREVARPGEAPPPASADPLPTADWSRSVTPDPVLLFRYSALTFNGHRIHYDRPYCREAEGYPGLVVHGPLTATLLMDLVLRNLGGESDGRRVAGFRFRARRPLFDTAPFTLNAADRGDGEIAGWAVGPDGQVAMTAEFAVTPGADRP